MTELDRVPARAAVVRGPQEPFVVEDVTLDPPAPDEVLVDIAGVGVCHTDLMIRAGLVAGPLVPGHEAAGVVRLVGSAVRDIAPGDSVVISYDACGRCPNCLRGSTAYCETFWPRNLSGFRDGRPTTMRDAAGAPVEARWFGQSSFATVATAPARNIVKIDPSLPLALLGPLTCSVLTGAGSVFNSLPVEPGSSFVVFGTGTVGLSAVMAARAAGAATIVAVDVNPRRLELAQELGATHAFDARADGLGKTVRSLVRGGLDASLDTTGRPDVLSTALDVLRVGGSCGGVGVQHEPLPVRPDQLALGRSLRGILMGDAVPGLLIPRLLDLWKQDRFPFDRLVTTFALDEVNEAAEALHQGTVVKPVLVPQEAVA